LTGFRIGLKPFPEGASRNDNYPIPESRIPNPVSQPCLTSYPSSWGEGRPEGSISGAIVDKNARIGRGVKITPMESHENYAGHGYMVRDGITVIEKDAVIPDGAVI